MYRDDKLADIFVNKTEIFKNIHPNIISCTSILLNVPIFFVLHTIGTVNISPVIITLLIATRCITDILDGAIARKYDKVSVLGGSLDTIGDISLICIIIWFIMKWSGVHYSIYIVFICLVIAKLALNDLYHDHSSAKIYSDNIYKNFVAFMINNTVVFFSVLLGVILYKSKSGRTIQLDVGDTPAKN